MLFNSFEYALFLPTIFLLYWAIRGKNIRLQNILILVASYFFYGYWDWRFLSLIIFSSLIDYYAGIKIYENTEKSKKRFWLYFSVFWNLGVLFTFKYFNFFLESFETAFGISESSSGFNFLNIILPVGLSFYTFQTMSYTIDIYKNRIQPTTKLIEFLCFVSFFPQLVAGPVERAKHLLPQFINERKFDYDKAKEGLRQILWGLFKKIVIADNLAVAVNQMHADYTNFQSLELFYMAILYYFQLYCDFSGYVDIAIGSAKLFGFDLSVNFRMPHLSRSIRDFWRRWNITLSQWFRDYLYVPYVRKKPNTKFTIYSGLFITFTLVGFWHGANWNYLVFGVIHSLLVILYRITGEPERKNFNSKLRFKIADYSAIASNFVILILTLIIFRAPDVSDGFGIIYKIFQFVPDDNFNSIIGLNALFILPLLIIELPNRKKDFPLSKLELQLPRFARWIFYYILIYLIIRYPGPEVEYIYFQF